MAESQALAKITKNDLPAVLDRHADFLTKLLPAHTDVERFVRTIRLYFDKAPNLYNCTRVSVLQSIMFCADMGLEPGLNRVHIVPYGDTATPIIGFSGMIEIALRSGRVIDADADIVCANDHFKETRGLNPNLEHVPAEGDRGKPIGAYAVVTLANGMKKFKYMPEADILHIKKSSKTGNIWEKWPDQMWKKTVIRQIFKYIPLIPGMAKAIELDNRIENGEGIRDIIDLPPGAFADIDERPKLETGKMSAGTPTGYRDKKKNEPPKEEAPKVEPKQEAKVDDEINLDDDDPYKEM